MGSPRSWEGWVGFSASRAAKWASRTLAFGRPPGLLGSIVCAVSPLNPVPNTAARPAILRSSGCGAAALTDDGDAPTRPIIDRHGVVADALAVLAHAIRRMSPIGFIDSVRVRQGDESATVPRHLRFRRERRAAGGDEWRRASGRLRGDGVVRRVRRSSRAAGRCAGALAEFYQTGRTVAEMAEWSWDFRGTSARKPEENWGNLGKVRFWRALVATAANLWSVGGYVEKEGVKLAPQVGFEPTTLRLTAECSTIELLRSKVHLYLIRRRRTVSNRTPLSVGGPDVRAAVILGDALVRLLCPNPASRHRPLAPTV